MIIELWIVFIIIIALFLTFGYKYKIPMLVFVGWMTLLILAWDFELNGMQYAIGLNQTTISATNVEAYDITDIYQSHTLGFMFILIAALAFVSVFFTDSLWKDDNDA